MFEQRSKPVYVVPFLQYFLIIIKSSSSSMHKNNVVFRTNHMNYEQNIIYMIQIVSSLKVLVVLLINGRKKVHSTRFCMRMVLDF